MKIGESRIWTEAEVQEAIAKIKETSGLWEEMGNIEKTTADFTDTEAEKVIWRTLAELHPECTLSPLVHLFLAIRNRQRAELGLS